MARTVPIPKLGQGLAGELGIAADFDIGGKRVADAQIVNGLVRIKDSSSNVGVSFVLEAHYFFTESRPWPKCYGFGCNNVAFGPFVAIEIGGGTSATTNAGPITGYALGMMVGLQHPDAPSKTSSWNFGVGLRVDPQAKVLGDGFVANQPPPAGRNCHSHKDGATLRLDAALVVQLLDRTIRTRSNQAPVSPPGLFLSQAGSPLGGYPLIEKASSIDSFTCSIPAISRDVSA